MVGQAADEPQPTSERCQKTLGIDPEVTADELSQGHVLSVEATQAVAFGEEKRPTVYLRVTLLLKVESDKAV